MDLAEGRSRMNGASRWRWLDLQSEVSVRGARECWGQDGGFNIS